MAPDLGDYVTTPVAPGHSREGIIYDAFTEEGIEFFLIAYRANDEITFVVRREGQFQLKHPTGH